ncbi:Protein of unknown function [Cotesia congregata]|uniref:Uncharacterized protein n=1 Tax=Cotesia congregata TaxID=51543 RepID=A0A8J2HB91_COTCN|nr:Protein of unknown function [Cotesia congregata]
MQLGYLTLFHVLFSVENGHNLLGGSFGFAQRALLIKLSETLSVTILWSPNNFLLNTRTEKYLLKYSRYKYLSIVTSINA